MFGKELAAKASRIKLLVCDIDGVMTDGRLHYTAGGETTKVFNVKDGLGLRALIANGIEVAVITARDSGPLVRRIEDLSISHFVKGCSDKMTALEGIVAELSVEWEEVTYIGDDIVDLPAMMWVGLSVCPADGHDFVRERVHYQTSLGGGQGCVRELADELLKARMTLDEAYAIYLSSEAERKKLKNV